MVRITLTALGLTAVLCSAACSTNPFPTTPTDTSTPPIAVTETFEGQLTINGAAAHPFAVQRAGTVSVKLTAVDPEDVIIGVSLGTWNIGSNVCQLIVTNDAAPGGATVVGTASVPGNFCVRVYDVGRLSRSILYTLDVTHF